MRDILFALLWPPFWALIVPRLPSIPLWLVPGPWLWRWLIACLGVALCGVLLPDWKEDVIAAASALGAVLVWWWRSGKRKRIAASLGAKSRALRAKLVRKVREARKPRQVLRPVPQGAS